jgi:hypothetical protein
MTVFQKEYRHKRDEETKFITKIPTDYSLSLSKAWHSQSNNIPQYKTSTKLITTHRIITNKPELFNNATSGMAERIITPTAAHKGVRKLGLTAPQTLPKGKRPSRPTEAIRSF